MSSSKSLPSLWKDFTCPQPLVFSLQNPFASAKLTFNKTLPEMRFIFTKCLVPCAIWGWPGAHLMWHNSWFQKHDFRPWLKPRLKQLVAQLGSDFFQNGDREEPKPPQERTPQPAFWKGMIFYPKICPSMKQPAINRRGWHPGEGVPGLQEEAKRALPPKLIH